MKHSNLQLLRDSSVAVPHIQRLILKGRGSEKRPHESLELHSRHHKFCVVMVVSDGLRSTLRWSKFSEGACPQTPLEHCPFYTARKLSVRVVCATWPHQPPLYVCPSPSIFGSAPVHYKCSARIVKRKTAKYFSILCRL